jgi:hypothetical protein
MKTEVYSWRLSAGLKCELERAARARNTSLSAMLETLVGEWLEENADKLIDDAEQKRLHTAAKRHFGVVKGRNPHRSERVSELLVKNLRRRYGR